MTSPSVPTDEMVVSQVTGGNVDAYAILMERYEPKLQRYVVYLIHDPVAASDVVQETFIKAYQNLRGFKPNYKFSSWLYRIAHNEAMNTVKKNRHFTDEDIENLSDSSYELPLGDLLDRRALQSDVHECVNQLEQKYRDIIQLVYFEHMKYEEVSDVLRVPTSTVGVWVSRAKQRLRVLCEKKGVKR